MRKPANFSWLGYSSEQSSLLDFLDYAGNNGWARNSQTDEVVPQLLLEIAQAGLSLERVKDAMRSVGYGSQALHQLDRWESKRTTGQFGRCCIVG